MASALLSSHSLLLSRPSRPGIACQLNIENSLLRTSLSYKLLTSRRTACKHGNFTVVASMLGRKAKKREVVVPEPDYRIPVVLLGVAGVFAYQDNLLPAATVGLLGLLLLFQVNCAATRVRFVFDEAALVRLLHPE